MNSRPPLDETAPLPGSIRAVIAHPLGGRVVMSGFPGLTTGIDGSAHFDPDTCFEMLEFLSAVGAGTLVVLVERDELADIGFDLLVRMAQSVGVNLDYRPIVDFSVPSEAMSDWWSASADYRSALFGAGGTMAFCCQYGAGRSGLMAALSLMDGGLSADDAIARVRQQFPEAVESIEQETWLRSRD